MRHTFKVLKESRWPQPGDLIRNSDTGDCINIVLSLSRVHEEPDLSPPN